MTSYNSLLLDVLEKKDLTVPFCFQEFLRELVDALSPITAQWWSLGIKLGLTVNDLTGIKLSHSSEGVEVWMSIMLHKRLQRTPKLQWRDVTKALGMINCGVLAEEIERTYCPQGLLVMYM